MPYIVHEADVSTSWLRAKNYIINQSGYECNNLITTIEHPLERDLQIQSQYDGYCDTAGITKAIKISSTIFPKRVYQILDQDRHKLYQKYYRLHRVLKASWGSYFNQMIDWTGGETSRNQLEDIILMINKRDRVHKAAYVIQITNPLKHLGWPRGAPCLNHILIQLENNPRRMSLLAVYRNHDFGVKAYGNYIGLGHLLEFLATETNFLIGAVTCISSHAFITPRHVTGLRNIALLGGEYD